MKHETIGFFDFDPPSAPVFPTITSISPFLTEMSTWRQVLPAKTQSYQDVSYQENYGKLVPKGQKSVLTMDERLQQFGTVHENLG
jgi:hypothetical protein